MGEQVRSNARLIQANSAVSRALSTWVYAAGVIGIAVVNLALGTFDPMQPVPDTIPGRTALAYGTSMLILLAGIGIIWRRTAAWSAAVLAIYFGVIVALLENGRIVAGEYSVYGAYFGVAEGFALAAAAIIIFSSRAATEEMPTCRLTRGAQIVFGLCALFFGGAHLVYPQATIPLVPAWLPPSQGFWAYATGLFHIAGGLAILTGVRARLAAYLLTIMYAAFTPLVHIPLLLSDPSKHFFWTENVLNIALVGVAWVVADSLPGAHSLSDSGNELRTINA
jgi:uncharacterized membrane protein YphA (DoxX/SURF4 family)/uncharacterized membrane protein